MQRSNQAFKRTQIIDITQINLQGVIPATGDSARSFTTAETLLARVIARKKLLPLLHIPGLSSTSCHRKTEYDQKAIIPQKAGIR